MANRVAESFEQDFEICGAIMPTIILGNTPARPAFSYHLVDGHFFRMCKEHFLSWEDDQTKQRQRELCHYVNIGLFLRGVLYES